MSPCLEPVQRGLRVGTHLLEVRAVDVVVRRVGRRHGHQVGGGGGQRGGGRRARRVLRSARLDVPALVEFESRS